MKNKIRAFREEWDNGVEPNMWRNRLNKLTKDGVVEGEEVDSILDRLGSLRKQLLKFYSLKETDL